MKLSESESRDIDDYLDGRLEGNRLQAFEKRLKQDSKFRNEFELISNLSEEVITADDNELKQKVEDWGGNIPEEEKKPIKRSIPFWLIILIIILLSLIPALIWSNSKGLSAQDAPNSYLHRKSDTKITSAIQVEKSHTPVVCACYKA